MYHEDVRSTMLLVAGSSFRVSVAVYQVMCQQQGNKKKERSVFFFPESDIWWGCALSFSFLFHTSTSVSCLCHSRFRPWCWQNLATVHEKLHSDISPYLNSPFFTLSENVGLCEVNFPFLNPTPYLWLTKKISTSIKGLCWTVDSAENHYDSSLIPLQNSPMYDCLFLSVIVFIFHGYDEKAMKYINFLLIRTQSQGIQSLVSLFCSWWMSSYLVLLGWNG